MTNAKHTPGPWSEDSHSVYADSIEIVRLDQANASRNANAQLIASAPDLLETLEAVRNDCESWLSGDMDSLSQSDLLQAFISAAGKAIAKATE